MWRPQGDRSGIYSSCLCFIRWTISWIWGSGSVHLSMSLLYLQRDRGHLLREPRMDKSRRIAFDDFCVLGGRTRGVLSNSYLVNCNLQPRHETWINTTRKFVRQTTLNDCQCLFVCWMRSNFINWWYLIVVLQPVILPPSGWNENAALSHSFTFSLLITLFFIQFYFLFSDCCSGHCDSGCVPIQGLCPSKDPAFAVFKGESFGERAASAV